VIVVSPTAALMARPLLPTVATDAVDDVQLEALVRSLVVPFEYVPVAWNCSVVPSAIEAFCGETATETRTGAATLSCVVPLIAPIVALIVVLPGATVVANPCVEIVAIPPADEVQVVEVVKFSVFPLVKVPVAVNCCELPKGADGFVGVTERDFRPVVFPVPLRPTKMGLPKALNGVVSVPVRAPVTVGVKVIPMVHVCPALTPEPQVLLAIAKSPETLGPKTVSFVLRWFVIVTDLAAVVLPIVVLANANAVGLMVTGAEPVPVRVTAWGLFALLSVNVSVPERAPVLVGENCTPIEQVAPPAMLEPQVLLAIEKSPLTEIFVKARAAL
jgi:hypothetical protein